MKILVFLSKVFDEIGVFVSGGVVGAGIVLLAGK